MTPTGFWRDGKQWVIGLDEIIKRAAGHVPWNGVNDDRQCERCRAAGVTCAGVIVR